MTGETLRAGNAGEYELEPQESQVIANPELQGFQEVGEGDVNTGDAKDVKADESVKQDGEEVKTEEAEQEIVQESQSEEQDGDFDKEFPAGPGPEPLDLGNGKVLKASDFKSPEHFELVRQGFMRTAHFTQKNQEVAEIARKANAIIEQYSSFQHDPQFRAQVLKDVPVEEILQEAQRRGLEVDPSLLQPTQNGNYRPDPGVLREVRELRERTQRYESEFNRMETERISRDIASTIADCTKDIKDGIAKEEIKGVALSRLLMDQTADVRMTVLKAREDVRQKYAKRTAAKIQNKIGTVVSKGKGGGVPQKRNAIPQTWADIVDQ